MLSNVESGYPSQSSLGAPGIRGKRVAVMGDAAGLSRAITAVLAENGAPVFLAARSAQELSQALAAVAQVGGEADGMVIGFCQLEDVQRFFDQAEYWLGGLDAVVNYVAMSDNLEPGVDLETCHNQVMQEAICRMSRMAMGQVVPGQIINVGPLNASIPIPVTGHNGRAHSEQHYSENSIPQNTTVMLRRQAADLGIRVTLIQPGAGLGCESQDETLQLCPEDIAHCIFDSLAQPFGVDVIVLKGQLALAG